MRLLRRPRREPSVAAVIGHADEPALLQKCVSHHLGIGVDHILVMLCNLDDQASIELARRLEQEDPARVRSFELDRKPGDFAIFSNSIQPAVEWADPEWLLFVDTDEFWLPKSGRIKGTAGLARTDVVRVQRFNLPLIRRTDGSLADPLEALDRPDDLLMIADRKQLDARLLKAQADARWIEGQIHPKVMARTRLIETVPPGAHDIEAKGDVRRLAAGDLVVLHAPFTTLERFERKLETIKNEIVRSGDWFQGDLAWHWKRWLEQYESGELAGEFRVQLIDQEEVDSLVAAGTLRRVSDFFN